jgi:hypothetical protein
MAATMTHRLQLLLDEERYQRVAAEAKKKRLSVAAVIRDAIDESLGSEDELMARKRAAGDRILAATVEAEDWGPDWDAVDDIRQSREERARAYD